MELSTTTVTRLGTNILVGLVTLHEVDKIVVLLITSAVAVCWPMDASILSVTPVWLGGTGEARLRSWEAVSIGPETVVVGGVPMSGNDVLSRSVPSVWLINEGVIRLSIAVVNRQLGKSVSVRAITSNGLDGTVI